MFNSEVFEKMTAHAKKSLAQSRELAFRHGASQTAPLHLLHAILLEKGSLGANILASLKLQAKLTQKYLSKQRAVKGRVTKKTKSLPELSPKTKQLITKAFAAANTFNYPYVGTEHLAYALLESADEDIKLLVAKYKINLAELDSLLAEPSHGEFPKEFSLPDISLAKQSPAKISAMPHIEQFCLNLNKEVLRGDTVVIGREEELGRMLDILGRRHKNNPLLIGDPGVGKTALVQGLAQKINAGKVSPNLATKTIYALDLALVVAGTTFRGEFENRLKEIIREATQNRNVILFIDEVHGIVGTGNSQGALDAANILKPALSSGDVQCIGATTYAEYKKYIEKDPALVRRFQPLQLKEPSLKDAVAIIEKTKHFYEKFHGVSISKEVITAAVGLSVRYINNRFLPDKAIDLIDEAASAVANKTKDDRWTRELKGFEKELEIVTFQKNELVRLGNYEEAMLLRQRVAAINKNILDIKKKQDAQQDAAAIELTLLDIAEVVSRTTGIPLEKIVPGRPSADIQAVEKKLAQKIIGQAAALENISNTLIRSHSGIINPDRPLGSFLFLGPTGVGKTLTAKLLAQEIFARPDALIRIDMSEFMEKHNLAQLLGAPAGYVGFEEGGKLTEKVRRNPYSLVLFDEIEKAHPDMSNILLQILEEGMLTDAQGQTVDFKNTIIILTSNLGTADFTQASQVGFATAKHGDKFSQEFEAIKSKALAELKKSMRPEILNRLDQVIVFKPLSQVELQKIATKELQKMATRLVSQQISLKFAANVAPFLAKQSSTPEFGARLVRKNIQDLIETPVAKHILSGKIKAGKITVSIKNNSIRIA